jgi:hypothetical protein
MIWVDLGGKCEANKHQMVVSSSPRLFREVPTLPEMTVVSSRKKKYTTLVSKLNFANIKHQNAGCISC